MLEQLQQAEYTPLMKQYFQIKNEFPDALLFFQVGDFYELFFQDAVTASSFLGIALTKRGKINGEPIPLCGVPIHALDHYLTKLVKAGYKIALCDQLEPAVAGKVVSRGVTKVLTPATVTQDTLLDAKSASYLLSCATENGQCALVFAELLTAQLYATAIPVDQLKTIEAELSRFFPSEVVIDQNDQSDLKSYFKRMGYFVSTVDKATVDEQKSDGWKTQLKGVSNDLSIERKNAFDVALSAFYAYMSKNQQSAIDQFRLINWYESDDFLILDAPTVRNLELVANNHDGSSKNSLFSVLDHACTPMGSRMIKKWILRPLTAREPILQRQAIVQQYVQNSQLCEATRNVLLHIGDLERIVGRMALYRSPLSDYRSLLDILRVLPECVSITKSLEHLPLMKVIRSYISDFAQLHELLERAINIDPMHEWMIKAGFDATLDSYRELIAHAHEKIVDLERAEQGRLGINSLKIRYNQVTGYSIEITKTHLEKIPDDYKRLQTLVGKERYITPALAQLQHDINAARNSIEQLEKELFDSVKRSVAAQSSRLRKCAHALAHLDALISFADSAYHQGYVCPTFISEKRFSIVGGKHPLLSQTLSHSFIANDTELDALQAIHIITGPNMGGKSTYLRQTALIAIMAHTGSFVPASSCELSLIDRIFTRIGSGDNLAQGKSTFLVEMEETATICTQATARSLVILDEVGRGTSTFDGLALAQAIVEFLSERAVSTLFATHYHELALLEKTRPGIVSFHAACKKADRGILFLHKIVKGVGDGSFGIEVAKLANVPEAIIERAQEIALSLEMTPTHSYQPAQRDVPNSESGMHQKELESRLKAYEDKLAIFNSINIDDLSPRQAFDLVLKIKAM